MRRCDKCGVEFTGELDLCPLCQSELTGQAEPSLFPPNQIKETGGIALKVLMFATGAFLLVTLFFGYLLALPSDIIILVCVTLAVNHLFVRNILEHAPDFLRVVARYFLLLIAIALVWFIVTRNLVVTTFVIPSICLVALVFNAVLIAVFRGTFVSGYAKYLLFDFVLGLMPMVLVTLGLTTWEIPSYASALVSCLLLLALFAFTRKQLIAEVRKLFSA